MFSLSLCVPCARIFQERKHWGFLAYTYAKQRSYARIAANLGASVCTEHVFSVHCAKLFVCVLCGLCVSENSRNCMSALWEPTYK